MGLHRPDAMMLVRAQLCERLDTIESRLERSGPLDSRRDALALAAQAGDYGLVAAQRLAEGLAAALGKGGRGAAVRPWIERLRDAVGCESTGGQAVADAWLAAVMVRLAG